MDLIIKATNSNINCTIWEQPLSTKVMIIAPAIGVSRHFYRKFAEYYSNMGYTVLTFDYTGIISDEGITDEFEIALKDWGERDIYSVINYCYQTFEGKLLYFVGHSISGQLFPMAANCNLVTSSCFVASQNASLLNWKGYYKLKVSLFWHLIIPFFVWWQGEVPGYAYGGKYALQSRIATDWASWGKSTSGIVDRVESAKQAYNDINVPAKFFSIAKDPLLAPKRAVMKLYHQYGSSAKKYEHIDPKKYGISNMNHFDFFRSEFSFLWPKIDVWFQLST